MASLESLLNKIDETVKRVNLHKEYSNKLRTQKLHSLKEEAARHSNAIELVAENLHGNNLRRKEKLTQQRLGEASVYLDQYGLNMATMSKLGHILEPERNTANFRNELVQFGPFMPSGDFQIISSEVDNVVWRVHNSKAHPILRALDAHVDLVKIHPYKDGNGRVARLIQTYVLDKQNYPVAVIHPAEREHYIRLMEGTIADRMSNKSSLAGLSKREELLYTFVMSKILIGAQEIEEALRESRKYEIVIDGLREKGQVYAVMHMVKGAHSQGKNVTTTGLYFGKDHSGFDIRGDLSEGCVKKLLDHAHDKYHFGYKIKIKND
jgi:hypothetical protein